jgi:hypothetical protein
MVVHSDQARQRRVACHVHALRISRNQHYSCVADRSDLSAGNYDRLVSLGRRSCSIDHAHVLQSDHWRLHADEIFNGLLRLGEADTAEQYQKNERTAHEGSSDLDLAA